MTRCAGELSCFSVLGNRFKMPAVKISYIGRRWIECTKMFGSQQLKASIYSIIIPGWVNALSADLPPRNRSTTTHVTSNRPQVKTRGDWAEGQIRKVRERGVTNVLHPERSAFLSNGTVHGSLMQRVLVGGARSLRGAGWAVKTIRTTISANRNSLPLHWLASRTEEQGATQEKWDAACGDGDPYGLAVTRPSLRCREDLNTSERQRTKSNAGAGREQSTAMDRLQEEGPGVSASGPRVQQIEARRSSVGDTVGVILFGA